MQIYKTRSGSWREIADGFMIVVYFILPFCSCSVFACASWLHICLSLFLTLFLSLSFCLSAVCRPLQSSVFAIAHAAMRCFFYNLPWLSHLRVDLSNSSAAPSSPASSASPFSCVSSFSRRSLCFMALYAQQLAAVNWPKCFCATLSAPGNLPLIFRERERESGREGERGITTSAERKQL